MWQCDVVVVVVVVVCIVSVVVAVVVSAVIVFVRCYGPVRCRRYVIACFAHVCIAGYSPASVIQTEIVAQCHPLLFGYKIDN